MSSDGLSWVESLCDIPLRYQSGALSISQLFHRAAPDLGDPRILDLIRSHLRQHPELLAGWQNYSYDKRGVPSPFLDGLDVGFVESSEGSVVVRKIWRYESPDDACAQFILSEAAWVLQRRELPE